MLRAVLWACVNSTPLVSLIRCFNRTRYMLLYVCTKELNFNNAVFNYIPWFL